LDVNMKYNYNHQTVFQIAAEKKNHKIVELLLTRNDLNISIFELIKGYYFHYVELLLASKNIGFDINARDQQGNNALHYSINENNTRMVELLLNRQDLDINSRDKQGNTALHLSINDNRLDIVSMLLNRQDIDINAKGEDGNLPLDQANLNQNSQIIQLLLKHGAQETNISTGDHGRKIKILEDKMKLLEKNMQDMSQSISNIYNLLKTRDIY